MWRFVTAARLQGLQRGSQAGTPLALLGVMEATDFDLEDVLRLARQRCTTLPPCLDCVAEATTDLILNRDLGPDWDEILEEHPVEEELPA